MITLLQRALIGTANWLEKVKPRLTMANNRTQYMSRICALNTAQLIPEDNKLHMKKECVFARWTKRHEQRKMLKKAITANISKASAQAVTKTAHASQMVASGVTQGVQSFVVNNPLLFPKNRSQNGLHNPTHMSSVSAKKIPNTSYVFNKSTYPASLMGGVYSNTTNNPSIISRIIDIIWLHKIGFAVFLYVIFCMFYIVMYASGLVPESLLVQSKNASRVVKENQHIVEASTAYATNTANVAVQSQNNDSNTNTIAHSATNIVNSTTTQNNTSQITKKNTVVAPKITTNTTGQNPLRVIIPRVGVDTGVYNTQSTDVATIDVDLKKGAVRYVGSPGLGGKGNTFILAHSTSFAVVNNQAYKAFNGLKHVVAGDEVQVRSIDKVYTYSVKSVRLAKDSDIFVDFNAGKDMLTLVTCNVLGAKEDRYVVEAYLTGVEAL